MATEEDRERLAEIVEYTRRDLASRGAADAAVHIHYHAAPAPVPIAPPPPTVLDRFAPHMVLALYAAIVLGIFAVVFVMIAEALMIAMISCAVCAVAVAAAARTLRTSKYDAEMMKRRLRETDPRRK